MSFYPSFGYLVYSCLFLLQCHKIVAQNAPKDPPGRFSEWTGWGANVYNNRWSTDQQINSTTIGNVQEHCKLEYPLGVSATPVVINSTVYYPTSNGSFYALNIGTCKYVWELNVTQIIIDEAPFTGFVEKNALAMSRTSPQIDLDNGILYLGTQAHALLIAVNLTSGQMLGKTRVHDHPLAIITMSPTLYNGTVFVGVSSLESSATVDPTYPCCSFIGSINAYNFDLKSKNFTRRWQHLTLPENSGWTGAGSWGSQPAIDPQRNQVFFATGNIYTYPQEFIKCLNQTADCYPDDVWEETVVAFDMDTGNVNWKQKTSSLDAWVMVCGYAGAPSSSSALCPDRPGPDADFGMAPTFVPAAYGDGTTGVDSIIIGQKSGNLYSFNAITGALNWKVATSPTEIATGGAGEMSWGVASDDNSIYYTAINYGARNFTIMGNGAVINNSAWGAASLKTGIAEWQVPVPDLELAYSPPAVVNDLMIVGRSGSRQVDNNNTNLETTGAVIALSKVTGATLKEFPLPSIQRGGVTISNGLLLFGSGYHYQNTFKLGYMHVYGLPDAIEAAKNAPPVSVRSPNSATGEEPAASGTQTGSSPTGTKKSDASRRMTLDIAILYPVLAAAALMLRLL